MFLADFHRARARNVMDAEDERVVFERLKHVLYSGLDVDGKRGGVSLTFAGDGALGDKRGVVVLMRVLRDEGSGLGDTHFLDEDAIGSGVLGPVGLALCADYAVIAWRRHVFTVCK
jgi:hypothetical protein